MEKTINNVKITLLTGDITHETTDAIVNAANPRLAGGGGVDGAIHDAAGPSVMRECREIGGCNTGEAVITSGGLLKARFIIHTVGPIYKDGLHNEPELLASAYRSSLRLAIEQGLQSISFPSISTGAYGYPVEEAARIALETVAVFAREHPSFKEIRFVLFSKPALTAYEKALKDVLD